MTVTHKPPSKRVMYVITGALLLGSICFLTLGCWLWVKASKTSSWPQVKGIITGSQLQSVYRAKSITSYAVQVIYRYEVEGQRYEGKLYSSSDSALTAASSSGEQAWSDYLNDPAYELYQKGSAVTVYYDPLNPGEAVLKPGSTWVGAGLVSMGAVLLMIAGWECGKRANGWL